MTRLIIIRHAESTHNLENRIQGHHDSPLTSKGLRQARQLAKRLKDVKIDKIYSSDLGRAFSTTREILRYKKVAVVRDTQLREIQLGAWEGMTAGEVDRLYDNGYQKWLKKPSACHIPGCEKVGPFRRRITERVRKIARANRGKTVAIVTHGGAITALLSGWLKSDFDHLLLNFRIDNTSITMADETDKQTYLKTINDTSHLSLREKTYHH